jgi:hypothetical protein
MRFVSVRSWVRSPLGLFVFFPCAAPCQRASVRACTSRIHFKCKGAVPLPGPAWGQQFADRGARPRAAGAVSCSAFPCTSGFVFPERWAGPAMSMGSLPGFVQSARAWNLHSYRQMRGVRYIHIIYIYVYIYVCCLDRRCWHWHRRRCCPWQFQ